MLPATAVIILIGKPLMTFVFGIAYAQAWLPLALLTCGQLVYAVFGMAPIALAMCGGERRLTTIYFVAVGAALVAAIPMTYAWGAIGAAIAPIITAATVGLLSRRYLKKRLGLEVTFLGMLHHGQDA